MGIMELNRIETNFGDYSVSFLPEARTRGIEHVSMRRLASTQSKYVGPNQNSICIVKNSLLPCLSSHFKRKEKWSQPMATSHKAMDAKRGALKRGKYTSIVDRWQNDEVYRESRIGTRMDWRVGQVPRLHLKGWRQLWLHLTDSDYDMKTPSTWEASNPKKKHDHCVDDLIMNH